MRVGSITTYPLKSGRRVAQRTAQVQPCGLAGDRRWMAVEPDGAFLSQRVEPRFTRIHPASRPDGGLLLRAEGAADLDVAVPHGVDPIRVRVWRSELDVPPAGADADEWLAAVLDRKARLVYLHDPAARTVDERYGRPDDRVSFADGYPLLLTNAASLDALNGWLLEAGNVEVPLPMTRLRPNVVVTGAPAWAEDDWLGRRLRIGGQVFRAVKPCGRCVVTTIDQDTGEQGREPLRVLARHRRVGDRLVFGLNLIPDTTGPISVGDPVTVVA